MFFFSLIMWILFLSTTIHLAKSGFGFAQISDPHIGVLLTSNLYDLNQVVNEINSKIEEFDLRFVIVTGDLSDNGLSTSLGYSKDALDKLDIPFFPIPGNKDMYSSSDEEYYPIGDDKFSTVFSSDLSHEFVTEYTGDTPVDDPSGIIKTSMHFQNFQILYENVQFIFLDFNSRLLSDDSHEAVPEVSNIYDFEGGTYPWLLERIEDGISSSTINSSILVMHQPFNLGWEEDQMNLFFEGILNHTTIEARQKILGGIAGHLHSFYDREMEVTDDWTYEEYICEAVSKAVNFRIFEVSDDGKTLTFSDFHTPSRHLTAVILEALVITFSIICCLLTVCLCICIWPLGCCIGFGIISCCFIKNFIWRRKRKNGERELDDIFRMDSADFDEDDGEVEEITLE